MIARERKIYSKTAKDIARERKIYSKRVKDVQQESERYKERERKIDSKSDKIYIVKITKYEKTNKRYQFDQSE